MAITEQDIYKALAEKIIPSPCQWQNSVYVCCRATGTGVAFRRSANEFTYRDPAVFNTANQLARWVSLPITIGHPVEGVLNSRSFGNTIVGISVYAYIHPQEDSPWIVCRILDRTAAQMIVDGVLCTSPGVVIDPATCGEIEVDGKRMLLESPPSLLDHVALIDMSDGGNRGVWQRDDGPGVLVTEQSA